jgi:hypothetical protein
VAKAKWTTSSVDPFDAFDIRPMPLALNQRSPLSIKQKDILRKQGIDPDSMNSAHAKQLLDEQFRRWQKDLCSMKQSIFLSKHGYDGPKIKREAAKKIMDALAKNQWKKLDASHPSSIKNNTQIKQEPW